MAHFVQLDDTNTVIDIIVIDNSVIRDGEVSFSESELLGKYFIENDLGKPGNWIQTSLSGSFRGVYAGIGYGYDSINDIFFMN